MCVEGTFPRPSVCAVCVGARASREPSFTASTTLYSHRYRAPQYGTTFSHFCDRQLSSKSSSVFSPCVVTKTSKRSAPLSLHAWFCLWQRAKRMLARVCDMV